MPIMPDDQFEKVADLWIFALRERDEAEGEAAKKREVFRRADAMMREALEGLLLADSVRVGCGRVFRWDGDRVQCWKIATGDTKGGE